MARISYTKIPSNLTPQQAQDLFAQLIGDMATIEAYTAAWAQNVFFLAAQGAASCSTLQTYNTAAIAQYYRAVQLLDLLRSAAQGPAGAVLLQQLPVAPPEPVLFGYGNSASYQNGLMVKWDFDCQGQFPDPAQLRMFGQLVPGACPPGGQGDGPDQGKTLQGNLGIAAVANPKLLGLCISSGPALFACTLGAVVLSIALFKDTLPKTIQSLTVILPWVATLEKAKVQAKYAKDKSDAQAKCVNKQLEQLRRRTIPTAAEIRQVSMDCERQANSAFPGLSADSFWRVLIPLGIVAGLTLIGVTGVKLYFKNREKREAYA